MMKEIYCLTGGVLGTNTYIVPLADKECFVVDPTVNALVLKKTIEDEGLSLTTIVLSHGHYDHMETLKELVSFFPKAKIAIHNEDTFSLGQDAMHRHYAQFATTGLVDLYEAFQENFKQNPHLPEPTLLLEDSATFENEWLILHTPGHTPGCICLYNAQKKILISGDTLFYMGWGRTDLEGGDQRALQKSLKRLYELPPDTKVFPGHGQYGFTLSENPIL